MSGDDKIRKLRVEELALRSEFGTFAAQIAEGFAQAERGEL
jgi:hypothetical protein